MSRLPRFLALLAALILLLGPATAMAQESSMPNFFADEDEPVEEQSEDQDGPLIDLSAPGVADCPGAPEDAYTYIPDPIFQWAKLECREEGHFISAADGYDWRSMQGQLFEVTAKNNDDLVASADQLPYFVTMGVAQLDTSQALHANELIDALVGQLSIEFRPIIDAGSFDEYWRLYILTKGQVQVDMYYFLRDGLPEYFVYCEKACSGGRKPQIVRVIASPETINRVRFNQ
ncbi:MAG: hypothetical protein KI792_13810 [Alphaproteobacteria bacterium]|nr:hypothetical protein [Alphaproteobacteria bacterium SS10]